MPLTTAESVAAAIAEQSPGDRHAAPELALDIAAAAELYGVPLTAALAYIHDRPRQAYSAPSFVRWCQRYRIIPAEALTPGPDSKEYST